MKNTFKEFARLKADELKALWAEATIVFDTNILLNLYEYSQNTRDSVFEIMELLRKQLWLPYKVGEEFYTRRISKIHAHNNSCSKIIESIDNLLKIDKESCLYGLLYDNKYLKKLKKDVDKISKQDKLNIYDDPIVEKIEKIYDDHVGQEPTQAEIEKIEKEYNYKTTNGIYCPGFKDSDKKNNSSGDLHLWKQMLGYAAKNQKSIIFVTEDRKDDWWWKPQGICVSARYELLKEFIKHTKEKTFYMCNFEDFSSGYQKYKGAKVDKKVTEEIKNVEKDKKYKRNMLAEILAGDVLNKKIYEKWQLNTDLEEYNKVIKSYENFIEPFIKAQKKYEILNPIDKIQLIEDPVDKYKKSLESLLKNYLSNECKTSICESQKNK